MLSGETPGVPFLSRLPRVRIRLNAAKGASPAPDEKERELLGQQPALEAERDGVGSRPCLQLCQEVADVGLDRLLGEKEALADLTVDQALRD